MKTIQQFQARIADEQGRVRSLQAKLFEIGQREEVLGRERQSVERELAGALGRMNAWTEARQIAVDAEKQDAARAQGGPVAAPELEQKG